MMRMAFVLAAALTCAAFPALAEEEHRQLGAHMHGHGRLNIAIEGKKLSMELEVPGADIAGFEHEPNTPEQRAAIAEARAKLANALALFVPAPKAGCELEHVKVTAGGHEDHADEAAKDAAKEEGEHHSEFRGEYSLQCRSPSRLDSINFEYFNVFSGARELAVSVIGPKGQSSFDVKRGNPVLSLAGIM